MKIYLDENLFSLRVVQALSKAGFKVVTPAGSHLEGAPDESHFQYIQKENIPILTKDAADFLSLHQQNPKHGGIIVIYEEQDVTKNMSVNDIVAALKNLTKREKEFKNHFFVLNWYRR